MTEPLRCSVCGEEPGAFHVLDHLKAWLLSFVQTQGEPELDEKDRKAIQFIQNNHGFAGTAEVAEVIGLTTNGAEYRLSQLEERGLIASRVVSRDKIWFVVDAEPRGVRE